MLLNLISYYNTLKWSAVECKMRVWEVVGYGAIVYEQYVLVDGPSTLNEFH